MQKSRPVESSLGSKSIAQNFDRERAGETNITGDRLNHERNLKKKSVQLVAQVWSPSICGQFSCCLHPGDLFIMNSVQVEVRREAFLSALRRLQQHHNQAITAAQYAPDSHLLSSVHFSPFTLPLSSSAHASPQDLPILQVAASAHRFKPAKIVVPPPSKKVLLVLCVPRMQCAS